jgi:hypothetical protein
MYIFLLNQFQFINEICKKKYLKFDGCSFALHRFFIVIFVGVVVIEQRENGLHLNGCVLAISNAEIK